MIHTFGCSFTKWHWPTWADWLAKYKNEAIVNHAHSGYTNELIYYQILHNIKTLTNRDEVYIMWTGSNRICQWYDTSWVTQNDCQDYFPNPDGQLWFGTEPWRGLYKTHPKHQPSLTHMIITMFDVILRVQMLLDRVGCTYTMMFWQNPWYDVREKFFPVYSGAWQQYQEFSEQEFDNSKKIMLMPMVQTILAQIKWSCFLPNSLDMSDPRSWQGLWEYTLSEKVLLLLNHDRDNHPNCLAHHDWTVFKILQTHPLFRKEAVDLAHRWQHESIPAHDRNAEIQHLTLVDQ